MQIERAPLPGPVAAVVTDDRTLGLIDVRLDRNDAAMALHQLLPGTHPDVVDHWLDTAYERPPFRSRIRMPQLGQEFRRGAMTGLAILVVGFMMCRTTMPPQPATPPRARRTVVSAVPAQGRMDLDDDRGAFDAAA